MKMTNGSYRKKQILLPVLTAICIAAVILAGMTAAGRMLSPDIPSETVPIQNDPVSDYEGTDGYDIILQKYKAAASGSWTKDRCEIEGISPRMQAGADLAKVGYARLDLDGDGRDELLIAEESVPHIDHLWDVYTTLEDGTPIQLWVDECDGNQCYLYEGNILGTEYTTKTEAEYLYYTLESRKLVMREGIWYEDEDTAVYMDAAGSERHVTPKEAMDISGRYDHQKLELTLLADIPYYLRDTDAVERYTPVLEKYRTALAENWTWEQYHENGISTSAVDVITNLGWCLMDVDGNGIQELIITDGDRIYDLYTLNGNAVEQILTSVGTDVFTLCKDGILQEQMFFSKGCSWYFYQLLDGKQDLLYIITYRNEYEGTVATERYYYGTDDNNVQPISKDEAGNLIMEHQAMDFMVRHFRDAQSEDNEVLKAYDALIRLYQQALTEKWDMEQCSQQNISLMISSFADDADRICAFFLDLDDDGVQELMITDGMMIYDLYTLKNGEAVKLLTGWERNSYRLCLDNVIYNQGSNGAASSLYNYYRLQNGELVLTESIIFDAYKDLENPWFRSSDGETPEEPLSEEEAREIMDSYKDISILGTKVLEMA